MARKGKLKENNRHRQIFEIWYANNRNFSDTFEKIPPEIKPKSDDTLYNWAKKYGWHARADKRDQEVAARLEQEAIDERAKMIKAHIGISDLLVNRAGEFFTNHTVTTAADAVRAFAAGVAAASRLLGVETPIKVTAGQGVVLYIPDNGRGDSTLPHADPPPDEEGEQEETAQEPAPAQPEQPL